MSRTNSSRGPTLGALLRMVHSAMVEEYADRLAASIYNDIQPAHAAAIQPLNKLEVALKRERRIDAWLMERRQKDAKTKPMRHACCSRRHVRTIAFQVKHWLTPRATASADDPLGERSRASSPFISCDTDMTASPHLFALA